MTKPILVVVLLLVACITLIGFELLGRRSVTQREVKQVTGWAYVNGNWLFVSIKRPPWPCMWDIALTDAQVRALSLGFPCEYVAPEHLIPRLADEDKNEYSSNRDKPR